MSSNNIEITMPNGCYEMLLKTAGTYCDKDIHVSAPHSFKIIRGSFTPEADTPELSLAIPAGAKMFVMVSQEVVSDATATEGRSPVYFLYGVQSAGDNSLHHAGSPVIFEYKHVSEKKPKSYSTLGWDTSNGMSLNLGSEGAVFVEGMTYNYTAYYWDE